MTTQQQIEHNVSSLVWFEIPADNVERAKTFYSALFGWNIHKLPGSMEYWHIDTRGGDDTPDGGLTERQHPQQGMVCYMSVPSVDEFISKVQNLTEKPSWAKPPSLRWATSRSARTQRIIRSGFGKGTLAQGEPPMLGESLMANEVDAARIAYRRIWNGRSHQ